MNLWDWFGVHPRPVDDAGNVANPITALSRALQLRIARLHDYKENGHTLYNTPYSRWRAEFVFETVTVTVEYLVARDYAKQYVGAELDCVSRYKPKYFNCTTIQAANTDEFLDELNALQIIGKLVLAWHFANGGHEPA